MEIVGVYFENHMYQRSMPCGQNAVFFFSVIAGGIYNNQHALKFYDAHLFQYTYIFK
jgi:hypothetical protein